MSVRIRPGACIGCGQCIGICPGNLIKWDKEKKHAWMRRPKDCWGCASCVKVCPTGAVTYFLGADIGGRGCEMSVSHQDGKNVWTFQFPDGKTKRITVDPRSANQY